MAMILGEVIEVCSPQTVYVRITMIEQLKTKFRTQCRKFQLLHQLNVIDRLIV
jgi:hypothetical protein